MATVTKILKRKFRLGGGLSKKDKQFIASGRITTVNAIATCFAHQINNPLQIMQGSIENLLERVTPADREMEEDLLELRSQADKIHELIQHLYRLIKHDSHSQQFISIRKVVLSAYALFEKQLEHRRIAFELEAPRAVQSEAVVYGDSVELEQVFINLFANARDALNKTPNPKISVVLNQYRRKEIMIRFSDNGEGISKENLKRVFDSLFTTKDEGTGLGLWLCFSVINQMDGKITVDSKPGQGTTFTIRLPAKVK
jgi:two-component system NtrC family sensor kinase